MAKFTIYSKDGQSIRYSGYPKYNGTFLNVSSLDFGTINSPVKIDWQVGDYVDYTRTGMRYRLYSIPFVTKQARASSCGDAFVYSNVALYPKTKDIELALFRDYVIDDNGIHFSTNNSVSTYENAYGIIDRVRACLNKEYPGEWTVRIFDNLDDDFVEKISESLDFSVTGSVMDACDKIYELWGLGWIHTIENGKDTLVFGRPNKRDSNNTTDKYVYGLGKGLTSLKKTISNASELVSRIYAYGSTRNMQSRYYSQKEIKDAESVDIQHLMIPLRFWGKTDNLPDASKAYIEDADKVAEMGRISKIIYFDGTDYPEIYPSLEKVTIGDLREVMERTAPLYPDDTWPDAIRVDKIFSSQHVLDDGSATGNTGIKYLETNTYDIDYDEKTINQNSVYEEEWTIFTGAVFTQGDIIRSRNLISLKLEEKDVSRIGNITVKATISDLSNSVDIAYYVAHNTNTGVWTCDIDQWSFQRGNGPIKMVVKISIFPNSTLPYKIEISSPAITYSVSSTNDIGNSFKVSIPQVGFDINNQTSLSSEGKCSIAMKNGKCGGRQFAVSSAAYNQDDDTWNLVCDRVYDDSLGLYFPNSDYQVEAGDEFVLLDIVMPEIYVNLASERLYKKAQEAYADLSKPKAMYEPSIDAIKMISSGWELREGMFMNVEDDDIIDSADHNDYVIIDTLTINEGDAAIPTYKVTLREEKSESFVKTTSQRLDNVESKVAIVGSQHVEYANRAGSASYATNARNSERWAEHKFADMMDQSVRASDSVAFESIVTWALRSKEFTDGVLGSGYKIEKDTNGNYTLELDNVIVRKALQVYELVIQQIRHQGGVVFQSAASMECTSVKFVARRGYICYFDNQQGSVPNQFEVGDLARCQRFAIGTTTAKYYWRAVTEVGNDYIVLSATDADTNSGTPASGDVIVQCGNKTNAQRQAVKITYAIGDNSPRDEYYKGINSYTLSGKLVTVVGVKDGEVGIYTENGSFKGIVEIAEGSKGVENLQDVNGRTLIVGGYIRTDFLDVDNIVVKQLNTNPTIGTDSIRIKDNEMTIRDAEGNVKASFHSKELGNMLGSTIVDMPADYMEHLGFGQMHSTDSDGNGIWTKTFNVVGAVNKRRLVKIPQIPAEVTYHHEGDYYGANFSFEFYISNGKSDLYDGGTRTLTAYKLSINAEQISGSADDMYNELLPYFPDEDTSILRSIVDGEAENIILHETSKYNDIKAICRLYNCQCTYSSFFEYAVSNSFNREKYIDLPAGYNLYMRISASCENYDRTWIQYLIPSYSVVAMENEPKLEIGNNGLMFYNSLREMLEMKIENGAMVVTAQNTQVGFELSQDGLRMKISGVWYNVSRTDDGLLQLS